MRLHPMLTTMALGLSLGCAAPCALAQQAQAPASAPTLPNGASSVKETFADWTVSCAVENNAKVCAVSQAQGNAQTGQRAFAIELRTPVAGTAEGTLLMPFGLKLDVGALLKLDDKDLGQGARFSTCVPQGCLIPLALPAVATDAMRKGKKLTVAALNLASGKVVSFEVSLNGFGPSLDRALQLAR